MQVTASSSINFTRIFDLISYQAAKYPNATALNYFNNGSWSSYGIDKIQGRVDALSCWFVNNGFIKGDCILLAPMAGTPTWIILDLACQQVGLITVPISPNAPQNELKVIIRETETKICITTREAFNTFQDMITQMSADVAVWHLAPQHPGYFHPLDLTNADALEMEWVNEIKSGITQEDIASILYTSGSSGEPKGAMLTHRNIVHNIKSILSILTLEPCHRVISFLPFSHILERTTTYAYLAFGVSLYFSSGRENFEQDFRTIRPYFCTSVPRVLEKMYDYLQEQLLAKNFFKRMLIRWAMEVGKRYNENAHNSFGYRIQLMLARLLVLRRWRGALGGKLKYMAVGAAALRPEIARLLAASGVQVAEGYGMTETSPLISINRFEPGLNQFGTVGLPIPSVDIKLDNPISGEEGEILVKGPNVMKGYFKNPALTRASFTADGWFRTGDVGKIDQHRFLKITDRKKEIFKTSSGKYIAPRPLQNHFTSSPFIQHCLIIGFQRSYVTALIVPHFQILATWCQQQGIHWTSGEFMVHNIKVIAKLKQEVDQLNETLPNFQRVRRFFLCPVEWSAEKGELTHTLKPIRRILEFHYQNEIEKMYSLDEKLPMA